MGDQCRVCSTTLNGVLGLLFALFGIRRSVHNPNVCNRCDAHLQDGRLIELTVLFADLTGFTALTNRLGAERSYDVVNAFFRMANEVLIRNDAFIDKYIGDAVMAIFNAPIPNPRHASGAIAAALGIQDGLKEISRELGLDLQARVGVATGYARVGRLGSTDRNDYTAIGDVVNLASRLEAFAQPGEVVTDDKAFAQVAENYPGLPGEQLNVRGFAEPVRAYRLGEMARDRAWATPTMEATEATQGSRKRFGVGTVLFTLLGAPCAVSSVVGPLALVLGVGSFAGALGPVFQTLDAAQIRIPLQILGVAGAVSNLYVVKHGLALRGKGTVGGVTLLEKRRLQAVVGLALFTLLAVAIETYVHVVVEHMSYFAPRL